MTEIERKQPEGEEQNEAGLHILRGIFSVLTHHLNKVEENAEEAGRNC